MTRRRLAVLLFPLALAAAPALAQNPSLAGSWARDDGGTRITITPCGANLCAVNTYVQNPGRERVGDELILSLQPAPDEKLKGTAYDVRRKMRFSMTITLAQNTMQTSGCVLFGIICKHAGWTRND